MEAFPGIRGTPEITQHLEVFCMYEFAIVALLALAVVKVVDFIDGAIPAVSGFRSLLTFIFAIASVWALDYSVFNGFGIATRNSDIAMLMTGFIVAGLTSPWRALFGYMTHNRAAVDETLGGSGHMRAA
jgi:hypothetical protein